MKYNQYKLEENVRLYSGMAGWHFVTITQDISEDIKRQFKDLKRGWGSFPVDVTIGKTTWRTSIFPENKSKGYLLPLKADVRKKEKIIVDKKVTLVFEIKV